MAAQLVPSGVCRLICPRCARPRTVPSVDSRAVQLLSVEACLSPTQAWLDMCIPQEGSSPCQLTTRR